MFEYFKTWFKGITTSSGKTLLDEVESCVKDIDTIQADMAEAKVILDEVKSFSPATLSAKITAFELLLSGLSDTITELKKTIPPSTPV